MRSLFFIISILLLASCNKDGNLENFPVVPSERVSAINRPASDEEICDPSLPDMGEATSLGASLSQLLCNKKCTNNFEVIPESKDPQGYLAFPIPGHLGIGRCRGHAIITQQFNMLSRFQPENKVNDCGPKNMSSKCVSFYSGLIEKITKENKVAEIPGFSSLAEFSSTPAIYKILYKKVIGYSHKYYANPGHLEEEKFSRKNSVFNELVNRVKNRQQPYIGIKGLGVADHAILATGVRKIGRQEVICVSDSNQRSFNPLREDPCENYIQMVAGTPTYKTRKGQTKPLIKFNLYSDEDKRLQSYVQAWQDECQKQKSSAQECLPSPKEDGSEKMKNLNLPNSDDYSFRKEEDESQESVEDMIKPNPSPEMIKFQNQGASKQ